MKQFPQQRLLTWYDLNKRALPWRGSQDPYAIWVSEIMLQQTQVETVKPYYDAWMNRFPSLLALSQAEEQEVLKVWEGLGYYSRARNMLKAARMLVKDFGGRFPQTVKGLMSLPGIGAYTAAAILSIAFGKDVAALDGNIKRVYARWFAVTEPLNSPMGEKKLKALADENLPAGQAGDYNQALMDLGAGVCLPAKPLCMLCPVQGECAAFESGRQNELPVVAAKPEVPHYTVAAGVWLRDGSVLLARRPSHGLLGGMWEYPGGKIESGETLQACLRREWLEELSMPVEAGALLGVYRHAYTHFKVTLHAFLVSAAADIQPVAREASELRWVPLAELGAYPMGKLDRMISRDLIKKNPG